MPPAPKPVSPSYDAVSIAALVCAVLCCAAPAGVILGLIGLRRTKNGQRRGRWAAVTGLILGAVLSLVMAVVGVVGMIRFAQTTADDLDPARVSAGQCIDFDWADTPNLTSCSGPHDGEIMWVAKMTADLIREWKDAQSPADFCQAQTDVASRLDYWSESFSGEPKQGSWMICYLTRR